MSRLALLHVPDDAVGELHIDWHNKDHDMYTIFVPIPEDDQLMRDLERVCELVEIAFDLTHDGRRRIARLRTAAGLDEE